MGRRRGGRGQALEGDHLAQILVPALARQAAVVHRRVAVVRCGRRVELCEQSNTQGDISLRYL